MIERRRRRRGRRFERAARVSLVAGLLFAGADAVCAETATASTSTSTQEPAPASTASSASARASTCTAKRPTVLFNRWQEDWSVLANPCVPRVPLDGLNFPSATIRPPICRSA
ncbi:hypothetical protein SY91_01946 [Burkholderia cenocepacia]|nr:hypothetical protein SY91_01946 [Burkholderia cenocepacia]